MGDIRASSLVATVPEGVRIVSFIHYRDRLFFATSHGIYCLCGEIGAERFEAVPVVWVDFKAPLQYPGDQT